MDIKRGLYPYRHLNHGADEPIAAMPIRIELPDAGAYVGDILCVAKTCAWPTPIGPLPSEVDAALAKQAERMERQGDETVRRHWGGGVRSPCVGLADIAEDDFVFVKGMKVRFKNYQDEEGVEGRAVTSV